RLPAGGLEGRVVRPRSGAVVGVETGVAGARREEGAGAVLRRIVEIVHPAPGHPDVGREGAFEVRLGAHHEGGRHAWIVEVGLLDLTREVHCQQAVQTVARRDAEYQRRADEPAATRLNEAKPIPS